jgi:hypothetical protein
METIILSKHLFLRAYYSLVSGIGVQVWWRTLPRMQRFRVPLIIRDAASLASAAAAGTRSDAIDNSTKNADYFSTHKKHCE